MEDKYLTITQLNRYIKFKIDQDANLNHVFLKGEISNFKAHTRGHLYFTLKDENSRINAVMFAGNSKNLKFQPIDGMKVMVTGRISVYESSGSYQIYVDEMIEDGVGNLYIEFEKLKKRLSQEGLFDPTKKKKIPKIPKRIGVVTASTGAAIKDILTTIKRRWPIAEVYLFPSLVQGANAAPDIIRQIENAQNYELDTLIVGRGGGSIEDLWCFNDEQVARTIFSSKIPVISAVGHEIDFTIADFVADLRAPTPTAAAELAVPNQIDFYNHLNQVLGRTYKSVFNQIEISKTKLENLKQNYIFKNPMNMYLIKEEKFDRILEQLKNSYLGQMHVYKEKMANLKSSIVFKNPKSLYKEKQQNFIRLYEQVQKYINNLQKQKQLIFMSSLGKLEVLNPLLTIQRGYSIAKKDGVVVDSVKKVKKDDTIEIEVKDGIIQGKVI